MSFISWESFVVFVVGLSLGWAAKVLLDRRVSIPPTQIPEIEPAIETLQTQYAVCHNAHIELEGVIASLKSCVQSMQASPPKADPLQKIEGIGPVLEAKLWEAGILKFSDLAATKPEVISGLIHAQKWQRVKVEHWIEEAAEFAKRA